MNSRKYTPEEEEEHHDFVHKLIEKEKRWLDLKMKVLAGAITTFFSFIGGTIVWMIAYIFDHKVGK